MNSAALHEAPASRRRAERRVGLHELVRQVAEDWLTTAGQADIQTALVDRLRRLVPAESVRLNELHGSAALRRDRPVRARDYIAYAVPVSDPTRRIVLEASLIPDRGVDDWTCQLLEASASLATLLFDAERLARLHRPPGTGPRDGAAPLIGSSAVMHAVRERVERVATTDFTVLIEGASDR